MQIHQKRSFDKFYPAFNALQCATTARAVLTTKFMNSITHFSLAFIAQDSMHNILVTSHDNIVL